jgi:Tfp pilus assembly protein PilF
VEARNSERLVRPSERSPRRRRAPSLILLAALLAGAGAIAAGFLSLREQQSAAGYVPRDVLPRLTSQTRSLAARLDAEPCNRTLALSLAQTLVEASEYRGMESLARGFHQRCGTHQDLLPLLFTAQIGLSDFTAARQTGDQLTQIFPQDPSAWAWRAEAREKVGDFEGSFADWRRALALFAGSVRQRGGECLWA